MARGDRKKGRENRKPKRIDSKMAAKSAYQLRQDETAPAPFKIKKNG